MKNLCAFVRSSVARAIGGAFEVREQRVEAKLHAVFGGTPDFERMLAVSDTWARLSREDRFDNLLKVCDDFSVGSCCLLADAPLAIVINLLPFAAARSLLEKIERR